MIRKILQNIILRILPVELIKDLIVKSMIDQCNFAVTMDKSGRFYEEAKVFNFRGNKNCITIGAESHVRGELLTFAFGGQIDVGSNAFIGVGTRIWSAQHIVIGDNVLISHNCNIIDTDSHELDHVERANGFRSLIKNGHSKVQGNIVAKPIFISDYAWISYNVSILKGVKIGKGAIVAAGSVVTKDVEDFTLVAGNPAVFVRRLNEKSE